MTPAMRPDAPDRPDDLWSVVEAEAAMRMPLVRTAMAADRLSLIGCGFHGRHALALLRAEGRRIAAFFDNAPAKQGTEEGGLPVLALDHYVREKHGFVLITARHVVSVLSRQLAARAIAHLSYDAFFVCRHLERFRAVREQFFPDAECRHVFDMLLLAMLTGDADRLAGIASPDQYFHFPPEMISSAECFVDAGAHDGDSLAAFLKHCDGRFNRAYAFEPTPTTFAALRANIAVLSRRYGFDPDRVTLFEAGVGARRGHLVLSADPAMPTSNAIIAEGQGEHVEVLSLDETLRDAPVTFLKADVEGMELDLLKGAAATIARAHPKLAISLYHRMEDFLEIPVFIAGLCGDYRFRLRHHSDSLLETVLYAFAENEPSDLPS